MVVYQDKENERWYFRVQIRGKRYHRAVPEATTRRDAEKAETIFKAELLQGRYGLADNKGEMLFDELKHVFIEYAMSNKRSWKGNVSCLNKLIAFFGGKRLKDITPFMIENYRAERKKFRKKDKSPLKNATINREIEVLRKMFNIAIDNDWLDENPCSAKKVKPFREDNKKERYLEPNEEARLLNVCIGEYAYIRPIIICALHTGMRKGEILNLKWDCVDIKNKYITLLV